MMGARLTYWAFLGVRAGVSRLPLGFLVRLGRLVGGVGWMFARGYQRLVRRNVGVVFEGKLAPWEADALGREHFARLVANLLAGIRLSSMDAASVAERVKILGEEHLKRARESERGTIMVLAHLGNWELLAQIIPQLFGGRAGAVYQRLGNPFIDRAILEQRRKFGLSLFSRKQGFFGALDLLSRGGAVGVLSDQFAGDGGVWIPFFGRLASSSPLAALMAIRSGAVLMSISIRTLPGARWELVVNPPEEPVSKSVDEVSFQVNRLVEEQIRASPADWLWAHNRWKSPRPRFLLSRTKRFVEARGVTQPFRLMIRSTNWLGDAVMTVPAVRSMARSRPDLEITVVAPAKLAGFWRRVPEVVRVLEIRPGAGIREVAGQIREGGFEAAVVFPNSLRAGLEVWWAGVPRRVGYAGHWRRRLFNQVAAETGDAGKASREHQVFRYLRLAEWVGAEALLPAEWALERRSRRAVRETERVWRLGVCPGAEYGSAKRWYPERFAEVMTRLSAKHRVEWNLLGVEKDQEIGRQIEAGFQGPGLRNWIGKTTLGELMDLLEGLDGLLTNDTGTMHLAAILGVPVVAIFGSTEPLATGPLGEGHRILRHAVPCGPCFRRECPLDFACMDRVSVEEVEAALEEQLRAMSREEKGSA
jgi:heptosyltransferase-2